MSHSQPSLQLRPYVSDTSRRYQFSICHSSGFWVLNGRGRGLERATVPIRIYQSGFKTRAGKSPYFVGAERKEETFSELGRRWGFTKTYEDHKGKAQV
jgi:hypothetical protein